MQWTPKHLQQLLNDLKKYGLNPSEWRLESQIQGNDQPQILKNINDEGFSLLGFPKKQQGKFYWNEIQILSL